MGSFKSRKSLPPKDKAEDATSQFIAELDDILLGGAPDSAKFKEIVLSFFRRHGRDFPWRRTRDPYKILVSEIMLQQTQTERVVEKYRQFLKAFPNWRALSEATPAEVVKEWMGLGYYRRAFNLHKAAKSVVSDYRGRPPRTAEELRNLPGVGPYTAAAVAAFAFGEAVPMIETNIRTVYLHVYYPRSRGVSDKRILEKVAETLHVEDPRAWFYALMDLGAALKKRTKGINKRSKHHVKQSKFAGSQRQARAAVLKFLVTRSGARERDIVDALPYDVAKVERAIAELTTEGLISKGRAGRITIAK